MVRTVGALRMVVVAAVLLVAGGIVAMHQFSIGHSVVVPVAEGHPKQPTMTGHQAGSTDDHDAMPDTVPAMPGHHDHDLGAMTCLAVVGLLFLAWLAWLRPRLPSYPVCQRIDDQVRVMIADLRRRCALSLQELSICLT